MGIRPQGDDLAAQGAVQPQPLFVRQRGVAPVGVELDPDALGDDEAEDLRDLLLEPVEADMHPPVLVQIPQGQRQMAQYLESPPLRELPHLAQVVGKAVPRFLFIPRGKEIQVPALHLLRQGVDGADEKVQRRGLRQHGLHPPDAPHGVSQLRAQAQRDPVPHRRPGGAELRNHGIPVIGPPGFGGAEPDGLHMVCEADLLEPQPDGRLRHLLHGGGGVR